MCSGRIDLEFILRAFSNGMDGVFIGGCRLNECNYITHGNYHALTTALLCKRILEYIGLDPDRLRIEFMSAGEGNVFTEVVNQFTKQIKGLGPIGVREGVDREEWRSRLDRVRKLIPYIKMVKREKLESRLTKKEEYDSLFTREEIERLFSEVVSYYIDPELCKACMICQRKCPVGAIEGRKNQIHVIDQDTCIKCGTCFEACPPRFGAVKKLIGEPVPAALPQQQRAIVRTAKGG